MPLAILLISVVQVKNKPLNEVVPCVYKKASVCFHAWLKFLYRVFRRLEIFYTQAENKRHK